MDDYQTALERYFRRHNAVWADQLEDEGWILSDFDVQHEAYWFNSETGTGWPGSTDITFKKTKVGPKGQKHTRKVVVGTQHENPVDFMRALFEED